MEPIRLNKGDVAKKIFLAFILILFSLPCVCAKTKAKKTEVEVQEGKDLKEIIYEEDDLSKMQAIMKSVREKEEKEKQSKIERTDEYTGHTFTLSGRPVVQNDFIRVEALPSPGTVGIYAIDESTRERIKLISNYEKFSTTFFSLLCGKRVYQLNKSASVIQELRQTSNSVQILYRIPNKARVLLDFKPVNKKSTEEFEYIKGDGVLKVCVYVTNLGARQTFLGIKGIFDTYLGENSTHFKTAGGRNFDKEAKFTELEIAERQWVLSENNKNSIQFLFFGKGITTPEAVYLGNRDTLRMQQWIPSVHDDQSFNSVLAYNNSAVGLSWKGQYLEKNETVCVVFYIAATPIKKIEFEQTSEEDAPIQQVETPENAPFVAADGLQQVSDDGSVIEPDSQIVKDAEKALADSGYVRSSGNTSGGFVPSSQPSFGNAASDKRVDFVVPPVTKEKLDPVYIQQLIDRIYSLQNDPQLIDRSEIRRLNAELDSILMKIREQRR